MKSRLFNSIVFCFLHSASLHAAVTLVSAPQTASDNATTGDTTFTGITVQAGDYVVISTSSNKSFAQNQLTYSWSGAEGVSGVSTSLSAQQNFATYLSYTSVVVGGTYDFSVLATNSNLTANSALYVLRPGAGEMILVAGTASQASASGSASDIAYLFGSSLTSGIAIEAATTQNGGAFTLDSDYLTTNATAAANGRLISYSTGVTGSSWVSNHDFASASADIASIGAVFSTMAVPEPSRAMLLVVGIAFAINRRHRP